VVISGGIPETFFSVSLCAGQSLLIAALTRENILHFNHPIEDENTPSPLGKK
jgi:hypothetical protein